MKPLSDLEISLTFPCHNEEGNVAKMIEDSRRVLERVAARYEIIVSDDGSQDKTREIAQSYVDRYPEQLRILGSDLNRGYGHALKSGLKAGRYDWVFFTAPRPEVDHLLAGNQIGLPRHERWLAHDLGAMPLFSHSVLVLVARPTRA